MVLAREGAQIVVTDICEPIPEVLPYATSTQDDLDETVRLVEDLDQRCLGIKADARSSEQMQAAVDRAIAEFGHIDVLCVNHGLFTAAPWESITDEAWDAVIEGDLSSVWRSTRPVIPHMVKQGSGSIIFTSSAAGLKPVPGLAPYVAAKHGVVGLARVLAVELALHSIRVNSVCPTNVATPMLLSQPIFDLFAGKEGATMEEAAWPALNQNLLPVPWVEAEDISNAVLFLASEESKYITGHALPVDAGYINKPSGIPPQAAERLGELAYLAQHSGSR
jgi:SDR family mycofactocin-dependent oxidoreductase